MIVNENVVFLRPQPSATPVDYIRQQVKAGMIVMPSRQLAIYTCKSGANVGPQGPSGEDGIDQNSWFDTIIASASDEYSPIVVTSLDRPMTTYRAPYPLDLTDGYLRMSLTVAPEGGPLICDVYMNGVSMFDTLLQIDADTRTSVGSAAPSVIAALSIAVPDDAEFTIFVTQIGTTFAGSGLKVALTAKKTS